MVRVFFIVTHSDDSLKEFNLIKDFPFKQSIVNILLSYLHEIQAQLNHLLILFLGNGYLHFDLVFVGNFTCMIRKKVILEKLASPYLS